MNLPDTHNLQNIWLQDYQIFDNFTFVFNPNFNKSFDLIDFTDKLFITKILFTNYLDISIALKYNNKYLNNDHTSNISEYWLLNTFNCTIVGENLKVLKLTHLIFGSKFNQSIDNLMNNLDHITHLIFGDDYDQNIKILAPSLTHLILGHNYGMKTKFHDEIFKEN